MNVCLRYIVYIFVVLKESSAFVYPKYEGCFKDTRTEVTLKAVKRVIENTLTIQSCTSYCFNYGYKYAATKNGTECLCDDLPENPDGSPTIPKPDSESLCSIPCSNDLSMNCGGEHALSLYSTGIKENEKDISDISRLEIGCVVDDDKSLEKILPEHKRDLFRTNTPKRCIAYCRALGYAHAGVQYRFECHCGVAKVTSPLVDGCDKPCSGDPRQNCGGNWRLMLYSTMSPSLKTEVALNGCYKYNRDEGIVRRIIPDITPNRCVAYCHYQGFPLAHISKGQECMCSNTLPPMKTRVPMAYCDKSCQGDDKAKCGGENHMVTYDTGSHGDPSLGKLESCHWDEQNSLLKGPKLNLGNENSISFCASRCIQMGYAFAALRNKTQCQCSQSIPARSRKSMCPDDLCNIPCPRAELQNCGGEKATAVYRTGLPPSEVMEDEEPTTRPSANMTKDVHTNKGKEEKSKFESRDNEITHISLENLVSAWTSALHSYFVQLDPNL